MKVVSFRPTLCGCGKVRAASRRDAAQRSFTTAVADGIRPTASQTANFFASNISNVRLNQA
jgi:hypothetical protein